MSDDEYTPEQKAKIARHFLLSAPHGEVQPLVEDLRKIMNKDVLNDAWLAEAMAEYNKRRFQICEGDSTKVICCPQAEVSPNKFLQPDKKLVCHVDPVEQKVVKEEGAADLVAKGDIEAYRAAIAKHVKEYVTAHYEDGSANAQSRSRGTCLVYASPQGQIAIVISFKNLNLNNFWSGGWQSEWTFSVADKGKCKLEGRIRLNVHYFEDGNVQLNSTFNESAEVTVSDVETTASSVVKTISQLENEFQERLEKFYTQMHESTFKNMRRFLPKIQQKMDWRASVHAVIAEAHAK